MPSEHDGLLFGIFISATGSLGLSAGRVWVSCERLYNCFDGNTTTKVQVGLARFDCLFETDRPIDGEW